MVATIGSRIGGSKSVVAVVKPVNGSAAEIMKRIKAQMVANKKAAAANDQRRQGQETPPEVS